MDVNKKEIGNILVQINDEMGFPEFEEIKKLIRKKDFYYHVTDIKNKSKIDNCGLLTVRMRLTDYDQSDKLKRAQICFAPKNHLKSTIANIKSKYNLQKICIYRISGYELSELDIGLDWTNDCTNGINNIDNTLQSINESINVCGVVACFENIKRDNLRFYQEKELNNIIT